MHTLSKLAATLVAGALLTLPVIAAEKAAAAPAKALIAKGLRVLRSARTSAGSEQIP